MTELDAKATALVLIDLQKGTLGMQLAPHAGATVVANAVRLSDALAAAGGTIVHVSVAFSEGGADRLQLPVDAPMTLPPGGLPAGWSELVPEIAARKADVAIVKRQWGAFHGTELDLQLRRRGIATVVVCGIATNFGVESTAREAWQHNYATIIAEDASSSVSEEHHRFAIEKVLPRVARIRSTDAILAALAARTQR
jgi:nicotinamidase-related amidase